MMRFLSRIRVNADIVGDAIGIVALAGLVVAGLWIGHGLGLSDSPLGLIETL